MSAISDSNTLFDVNTFEYLAEEGWTFRLDKRKRVWRAIHPSRPRNDLVAVSLVQCIVCACEADDRMAAERSDASTSTSPAPTFAAA